MQWSNTDGEQDASLQNELAQNWKQNQDASATTSLTWVEIAFSYMCFPFYGNSPDISSWVFLRTIFLYSFCKHLIFNNFFCYAGKGIQGLLDFIVCYIYIYGVLDEESMPQPHTSQTLETFLSATYVPNAGIMDKKTPRDLDVVELYSTKYRSQT